MRPTPKFHKPMRCANCLWRTFGVQAFDDELQVFCTHAPKWQRIAQPQTHYCSHHEYRPVYQPVIGFDRDGTLGTISLPYEYSEVSALDALYSYENPHRADDTYDNAVLAHVFKPDGTMEVLKSTDLKPPPEAATKPKSSAKAKSAPPLSLDDLNL